jgi:hypothetical protein
VHENNGKKRRSCGCEEDGEAYASRRGRRYAIGRVCRRGRSYPICSIIGICIKNPYWHTKGSIQVIIGELCYGRST